MNKTGRQAHYCQNELPQSFLYSRKMEISCWLGEGPRAVITPRQPQGSEWFLREYNKLA